VRRNGLDAAAFWRAAHGVGEPLGAGERSWHPYEIRSEVLDASRRLPDPIPAYREILATEPDPYWRELALFLAASSDDPRADDLLVEALDDAALRPRALYLLGVAGTRGWPRRARDTGRILRAILPHIDDATRYTDVVHGTTVEVGDLARAAFARIAGPDRFPSLEALPWTQADLARRALSAEIRAQVAG
jgi:hypothetical protein